MNRAAVAVVAAVAAVAAVVAAAAAVVVAQRASGRKRFGRVFTSGRTRRRQNGQAERKFSLDDVSCDC
ncbi:unnamed protein product [Merluccius merluccius]